MQSPLRDVLPKCIQIMKCIPNYIRVISPASLNMNKLQTNGSVFNGAKYYKKKNLKSEIKVFEYILNTVACFPELVFSFEAVGQRKGPNLEIFMF